MAWGLNPGRFFSFQNPEWHWSPPSTHTRVSANSAQGLVVAVVVAAVVMVVECTHFSSFKNSISFMRNIVLANLWKL